jgi:hypothetical protein
MGVQKCGPIKRGGVAWGIPVANWDEILSSQNVINNVRLFFLKGIFSSKFNKNKKSKPIL